MVETSSARPAEADRDAALAAPAEPAFDVGLTRLLAYRRRTLRFAAILVASSYFIDIFQPRLAEVAVVRALWIVAILVVAAYQQPARPARANLASYLGATATGAAVVGIVALNGGTTSIYAGMLIATPFAVLVGMAELPLAAALNGAFCVLGGAGIRISEGQPWTQIFSWLLLSSVMSALATWGTVAARRAWRIDVAVERERRTAVERLAELERDQAEAARFAEVGRIAARVAHEVNSPLAVVKSNVQWLGRPDPDGSEAERAEVVAETLQSVNQIVDAIGSVRQQAGIHPIRKM